MTYIVVSENEIVKAEMERPVPLPSEFAAPSPAMQSVINNYKDHCLSLPRIAAPGHKWQLWQEIELDKDFRMDEQFWTGSAWQPTFHLVIGNPGTKTRIVAIPIQPTPEGEEVEEWLPRTEFLLHDIKRIEGKIINWYKKNHYSQGDSYSVRVTKKGKWAVSYSNDYPMQHGGGQEYVLSEEDFINATTQQR